MFEDLDPGRPYKPLDVGEAGLAASIAPGAGVRIITWGHPAVGAISLVAGRGFAEEDRFDQHAVRRFRRRLASVQSPSLRPREGSIGMPDSREMSLLDGVFPVARVGRDGPQVVSFVPHPEDADGIRGLVQIALDGTIPATLWSGSLRLGRADYPELTEGLPLRSSETRAVPLPRESGLAIVDRTLASSIAFGGDVGRGSAAWMRSGLLRVDLPFSPKARVLALSTGRDAEQAMNGIQRLTRDPDSLLEATRKRWRRRLAGMEPGADTFIARRGLTYLIGCCTVPVRETVCLTTDHVLLPLAWTRDGYYGAQALLRWSTQTRIPEGIDLVRRHLMWLFTVADRPQGWWARSHLTHGQRKDPAYQLDQQLYPLLELVEYVHASGDRQPLVAYAGEIARTIEAIEARRAPSLALYATEETAADDRAELPYQTANQILAWHTFRELHGLGVGGGRLAELAGRLRSAVFDRLVAEGPNGRRLFAYATDAAGRHRFYHDANDVPLALAPRWGFCRADDPVWRATVEFAFSPANTGFFEGSSGGLGSDHTPGTWPLGILQREIVDHAVGGQLATQAGTTRPIDLAYRDGALPEASDPRSGRPISRSWFAWPGALAFSVHGDGTEPWPR